MFVDRIPQAARVCAVAVDNAAASYQGTRHLIELGHTRIAVILGPAKLSPFVGRLEGFRRAMQEARLAIREEYMKDATTQAEGGYQCTLELLGLREPPTAVFPMNSKPALGVMRATAELKPALPEQLSVIAIDDFPGAEYSRPALTAIAQPTYELGRTAMEHLLARMRADAEHADSDQRILLPAEFRVRQSTAPPRSSGRAVGL